MKITHYGATREITGSCHLLEFNGTRILLDCGMFQGKRFETFERNRRFPFNPEKIDVLILSHAHIDHSGNIPTLVRQGFRGNIYSTFATRDLCGLMLEDSAHVQQADADFLNRLKHRKGANLITPLYTRQEAEASLRQFVALGYDRPFLVADGVTCTFHDSGHLLGSAQVCLDLRDGTQTKRLLYTGDLGRGKNEILRDPVSLENVDVLMMECTYGDREHEDIANVREKLATVVRQVIEQKGRIIIPSFAVGRTQQVVYTFHQMTESGAIPPMPIYVDSPLAVNATEIFRLHPECFNQDIYNFLHNKRNPFGFDNLHYIRDVSHSKELNQLTEPAVIIAASGMCEAGRILHHLKNNITDSRNMILFVGYCAQDTLGARLMKGMPKVRIFDDEYEVKAGIVILDAFSAHADRSELRDYVRRTKGRLKKFILVHGEESALQAHSEWLGATYPHARIFCPASGEGEDL